MSYRFDSRTEDQFKQDIENASRKERLLMQRYVDWLNSRKNGQYSFEDNGVDNSGKFIPNTSDVTCDADFLLKKNGKDHHRIEIKHCNPSRTSFHLKINHINHCIKDDVCIVNWMGVETDSPEFCIITPKDLVHWLEHGDHKMFWQKKCLRLYCKDFQWHSYKS